MRFFFGGGKTDAQLAAEKKQMEDAKWAPVKRDAESRKAHHEQLLQASKKRITDMAVKKHQERNALLKQAALDSEKTRFEKKEPKENPAAKSSIFPMSVILEAEKTPVRPTLSQSNFQMHEGVSKQALDAEKKAHWHAKNEAEKAKNTAFKEMAKVKTAVVAQSTDLSDVTMDIVGPKKSTFFEVSSARRRAILEDREMLSLEKKAAQKLENRIESIPKPGF